MDVPAIKAKVGRVLGPMRSAPADNVTTQFHVSTKRTVSGNALPPYYLVYFLLVELMGFRNDGRFDKVAWSVPIEHQGRTLVIEHRKFGLGVFAPDTEEDAAAAADVARRLGKAVKAAEPYFDMLAQEAAVLSKLNVHNHSNALLDRYRYFGGLYAAKKAEAEDRRDEKVRVEHGSGFSYRRPVFGLLREERWLALATIESFFSWTEHVLILLSILRGTTSTGEEVTKLAGADWDTKFKAALDTNEPETKRYYDGLKLIRSQLRNVVAHGAFGKDGQAFDFHSPAGAVPMMMPHNHNGRFRFGHVLSYVDEEAIELMAGFVEHLWSGDRGPARIYIEKYDLPLILTLAANGEYARAMVSTDWMNALVNHLQGVMDRSMDMDF